MSKKDTEKDKTENQTTDGQGKVLPPGTLVPTPQDPALAEKGIYQPADKAANDPQKVADPEEEEVHVEHRKNLQHLPPVPSESAGAASQAK